MITFVIRTLARPRRGLRVRDFKVAKFLECSLDTLILKTAFLGFKAGVVKMVTFWQHCFGRLGRRFAAAHGGMQRARARDILGVLPVQVKG